MEKLITVSREQIGKNFVNSVSAQELHKVLGLAQGQFNRWVKKNVLKSLTQKIDYKVFSKRVNLPNNGYRNIQDYCLTIDTAIHLTKQVPSFKSAETYKFLTETLNSKEVVLKVKEPPRREIEFFTALEKVLKPMNISMEEQYRVKNYRIDGYIKEFNLAIEYDEEHHNISKNIESDTFREDIIKNKIKCRFIRLQEKNDHFHNIGTVLNQLFQDKISKKDDRQNKIKDLLNSGKYSTKELAEKLNVSKSTILRDLKNISGLKSFRDGRKIFYSI